jgi:N-acylneuraminate cytidylyltransferase/CMP-N,N'-diacetyllegionaminic acid synthase
MSDRQQPKVLAIVPARGGSKRVPGKNLKQLGGKPLIAHTISCGLECEAIERLLVTTDDAAISNVAKDLGAEVPFLRPAELAGDATPDLPVLKHALEWVDKQTDFRADVVVLLRPTAPLRTPEMIAGAIDVWKRSSVETVRSMCKAEGIHHPYWMFKQGADGLAEPVVEGTSINTYYQSQLLPPVYHLNGVVDVISADVIRTKDELYAGPMAIYETESARSLDIDTVEDFQLAEFLIKERGY